MCVCVCVCVYMCVYVCVYVCGGEVEIVENTIIIIHYDDICRVYFKARKNLVVFC